MTTNRKIGAKRAEPAPVITAEADRKLGRLMLGYGAATVILMTLMQVAIIPINVPGSHLFKWHRLLDILSVLVIVIPFFIGMNRVFALRLKVGRELVDERKWPQAIAALDPFASPTQRFLDTTGEAHYLLAIAYKGQGLRNKAIACQEFVLEHRPGVWAQKVKATEIAPRPTVKRVDEQDSTPRPAKRKSKRRF